MQVKMNTVKRFTIVVIYPKSNESTREPDYNTSLILNGNRKIRPIYPVSGTTKEFGTSGEDIHQADLGKRVELGCQMPLAFEGRLTS